LPFRSCDTAGRPTPSASGASVKRAQWSELVQWSSEPALHTRFHFGKYRGRRYDAVAASDPDYLRWIVEKSELEEGIKHTAQYWLAAASGPPDDR
jgi:exodeoxyribonuclease X